MTAHRLIESAAFDPETVAVMGRAYETARREVGENQPATVLEMIATRIIGAARDGERDEAVLTAVALRGLDGHRIAR
jgi:hypothetical protein